jgi:hypothetical protein
MPALNLKGNLFYVDLGIVLLLLVFIGFPLWNLYSDNKQKKWDGEALLISVIFLVGIYVFYYIFFTPI